MRILQIVSLITPDGAYGGPVRVAINQSHALAEAGHQVELVAGARGFSGQNPSQVMGFPVRLFTALTVIPRVGFAGLTSISLLIWLIKNIHRFDIIHIHLARDFITLPSAAIARVMGISYVVQTHGMIDASVHPLASPLDKVLTQPVLQAARRVLYLTDREARDLTDISEQQLALHYLPNGVPFAAQVARATSRTEVLFLARMHPRKRPLQFVEMAIRLNHRFPEVNFRLVGPDEGEGKAVQEAIERSGLGCAIRWEGALDPSATLERMSHSDLYVLPSVAEPFPMSVLEAMSLGLPVVVGSSCGLAKHVRANDCGCVFDESLEGLVGAVAEYLADPEKRRDSGERARKAAQNDFSMIKVAFELERIYQRSSAVPKHTSGGPLELLRRHKKAETD
ncbi:glycosyltransferase [Arthrobacter sp. TMS2-4]